MPTEHYRRSPSLSFAGLTQPARLRGGGTGAPPGPYRGLGSPRTADRAHFVASQRRGVANRQENLRSADTAPRSAPRRLPQRGDAEEMTGLRGPFPAAWYGGQPPPLIPAGHLGQGQGLLWVEAAALPVRAPRRGTAWREAGGGDGQCYSSALPTRAGLGGVISN